MADMAKNGALFCTDDKNNLTPLVLYFGTFDVFTEPIQEYIIIIIILQFRPRRQRRRHTRVPSYLHHQI